MYAGIYFVTNDKVKSDAEIHTYTCNMRSL